MAKDSSFSESISKTIQKQKKQIDANLCNLVRELMHSIIDYTPVGKQWYGNRYNATPGELVNNWQPAINSVNSNLQQRAGPNKTGAHRRVDGVVKNGTFTKDAFVTFTNATPYAFRAEYAGWPAPEWSGATGPYRMVGKGIADILSKYGK